MQAALETALERELPAEAEAVAYPPSAVEEAPPEPVNVFLPRRRPAVPPPAVPRDDDAGLTETTAGATTPGPAPARTPRPSPAVPRQAPDLALLGQVLRGLQRLA